ncbi:GNAT family N-acetyltransferase [Fusibacter sp. JL216-2]|uniref:GNAT family N-acetyltransferase n=1 Tax=Fusibacter sp. JL216-2 TaxID=3071453 RepID=UPI003D343394
MIKRLTINDLNLIEIFISTQNKVGFNGERVESFLKNKANYFLAYIEKNMIVGYAIAYVLQRYDGRESMMYLHEIEVAETSRKQGIGKALLSEMNRICGENDFMKLFLITNKSNRPAIALYESLQGETYSDDDIVYTFKLE